MLEHQLNEVSVDRGGSSSQYNNEEDDLQLDGNDYGDYGNPPHSATSAKKTTKKGSKKKRTAHSDYDTATELAAPQSQPTYASSPTAFVLPPSQSNVGNTAAAGGVGAQASATAAAAGQQAKKYLSSVTTYFNEKKDAFSRRGDGTDPELSGEMDDMQLREQALKRREAELLAKEQKVAEREREVRQFDGKLNNWPFKW